MFSLAFILFVIVGAVVLPEFGDDAVAELDGAVGLDAEFAGHLIGSIAFGHQLDSTASRREEGRDGCDGENADVRRRFGRASRPRGFPEEAICRCLFVFRVSIY